MIIQKVMDLELAKKLAQLLGSEQITDAENDEAHCILRDYAQSLNMIIHITDGGAVYLATSHDLRESSDTTRLA